MKAGFIQFCPKLGEQDENIKIIRSLVEMADGAQLIVLPELANSGYNFESYQQASNLAEEIEKSRFIDFLVGLAKSKNMFIVSGFNEKQGDRLFNTAVLTGPSGFVGKYRKMHLFMDEPNFFKKGDTGLPVFDIGFCKLGILICFDWVFPEVWRILALKGAEVIAHPSNLVLPYAQQAVPVHGLINRTFNITANRYGTERSVTFSGQSIISDPKGKTLHKAAPGRDEVKVIDLDIELAKNKWITPHNHAFNDRFPNEYKDLIKY